MSIPQVVARFFAVQGLLGLLAVTTGTTSVCTAQQGSPEAFQERWRWNHFTVEDGLPSNRVGSVLEIDGLAYAATAAGLAVYDGWRWEALGEEAGLPSRPVTNLSTDPDGALWVATQGGLFVGSGHTFKRVHLPGESPKLQVLSTAHGTDGTHLVECGRVGSPDRFLFSSKEGEWEVVQPPGRLPKYGRGVLSSTPEGVPWIFTGHGYFRYEAQGWTPCMTFPRNAFSSPGPFTTIDGETAIVGIEEPAEKRGLWKIGEADPLRLEKPGPGYPIAVAWGPEDQLVCLYDTHELRYRVGGNWHTITPLPPEFSTANSLSFRTNGDLWICTEEGLHLLRLSRQHWKHYVHSGFDNPKNRVNAIAIAKDGALWIGNAAGVEVRAPDGRALPSIQLPEKGIVTSILQTEDGTVWVSSGSSFTGLYGWREGTWIHLEEDVTGQPLPLIHRIRTDSEGRTWLLSLAPSARAPLEHQGNVYLLGPEGAARWEHADDLRGARTYDVLRTEDGALWFATYQGLFRFQNGEWEQWDRTNGLRQDVVFRIQPHGPRGVWIAQPTGGVGSVTPGQAPSYLPLARTDYARIWDLAPDGPRLWVTTDRGLRLFRRDSSDRSPATFEELTGLASPKAWPLLIREDQVLVGTIGAGLYCLDRSLETAPPPRVYPEVLLEEGAVRMQWSVASFWGDPPSKHVETRVRVDDGPWGPFSTDRSASLEGLAPGRHIISVQARGPLGDPGPSANRPVRIQVPLYRHIEFIAPVGVLLVGLIVLGTVHLLRRRRDAAVIRESAERYRQLMEQGSNPVLICDGDGIIRSTNSHAVDSLGGGSALLGRSLRSFLASEDPTEALALGAAFAQRTPKPVRLHVLGAGNRTIPVEVRIAPIAEDTFQVVLHDLSEQETKEKTSRALEDWAAQVQAFEDVGRATGALFQDLGNSHLSILGHTSQARSKLVEVPPRIDAAIDHLDKAIHATEQAGNLTREVLAYASQSPGETSPVDLNQLLRDLHRPISFLTRPAAEIDARLEEGLPLIEADGARVGHLIVRLVELLCASATPGTRVLTLRTYKTDLLSLPSIPDELNHLGREERLVALELSCNAPVGDCLLRTLLNPDRAEAEGSLDPRTSAIRGLVRTNRVALRGESDEANRLRVQLFFPAPTSLLPRPASCSATPSEQNAVLVIDDDLGVRHVVSRMLSRSGYRVLTASRGDEGIEVFREHASELLCTVIDVSMPDMDGIETRKRMLELVPDANIFLMSGLEEDVVRPRSADGYDGIFLQKPFTPEQLLEAMDRERRREPAKS